MVVSPGIREAVLRAVNLAYNADTRPKASAGNLPRCTARIGIPAEWREGLARPEMIEKALRALLGGKE